MKIDRISIGTLFLSLIIVLLSVCGQQADAEILTGHTNWVNSVTFSPNGQTIASGSDDRTIRLWDVNTGTELKKITGHTNWVRSVAFSPIGQTIASGSTDNTVRLWDVNTGTELKKITGHTSRVTSVAFSPNGQKIASGSADDTIRLWDVNTGTELKKITGHTDWVRSVAFSPNGQTIASGSDDDTVRLWDVNTGTELKKITGHTDRVNSVAFSPIGQKIASGSRDNTVRLWDLWDVNTDTDTDTELKEITGHNTNVVPLVSATDLDLSHRGDVRCVAYSPWGVVLASGGTDDYMRLWRTSNGEALATYKHGGDINSIAFSPNDTWIASGSDDGKVRLYKWSTTDDTWVDSQDFDMPGGPLASNVKSVAFSYDNTMLACGTRGREVYVWDYNPDQDKWIQRSQPLSKHSKAVNSVAFSPWGVVLASASDDKTVQLWNARTGEPLATLDNHTEDVNCVTFSRDDSFIASGSDDDTVILWKWSASDDTWVFHALLDEHDDDVRSVAFNPSGSVLLSASADKTIGVWDGRTGDYHTSLLEHSDSVNSVACNFQGSAIASGSDDGTVRQLAYTEAADIAAQGISLTLPSDLISDVAFGENSTYLVLNVEYPTITGIDQTEFYYGTAIITLDIPGVPSEPVTTDRSDPRLVNPGYFLLPLETPAEIFRSASSNAIIGLVTEIPVLSTVYGIGKTVNEWDRALAATADPRIILANYWESTERLDKEKRYVLFVNQRLTDIKIKAEQRYFLGVKEVWFDPVRTITFEGTWDLEDGVLAAPGAHSMSLSDYPPFQELPLEVQEYFLQHFGELINTSGHWQIPETTGLLPNYPNPFNPETWIPYQLAKPVDVTLRIYDINGRVVRALDLGHQRAGSYTSRTRAIHWDGKNEVREPVASGVYFYVLKAGDFTATRKMLIKK